MLLQSLFARARRPVSRPSNRLSHRRVLSSGPEVLEERRVLAAVPVGSEFLVNPDSYSPGDQTSGDQGIIETTVATAANGDYVIAWYGHELGPVDDGQEIFARLYSASGVPKGDEFRVNTNSAFDQSFPSAAMDSEGNFLITWQSQMQDGSGTGVYARRYDAAGNPAGGDFLVNATTTGNQERPSVAMNASGQFVITWIGNAGTLYGQRYSGDASPEGGEFLINAPAASSPELTRVAIDADGDFVVVWQRGDEASGATVLARLYSADGEAEGSEFRVGDFQSGDRSHPDVAMDEVGNFVVTWQLGVKFASNNGVFAQRYDAGGVKLGPTFQVDEPRVSDPVRLDPTIAMTPEGSFLIAWGGTGAIDYSGRIFARSYDPAGNALGSVFTTAFIGDFPPYNGDVAMTPSGDGVIVWQQIAYTGWRTFGQRFLNSDNFPVASIIPPSNSAAEGNEDAPPRIFTVSLAAASEQTVEVVYETADGTATLADDDYESLSGTLTFAPGETVKLVTVQVRGDLKPEANEDFTLNLTSATFANLGDATATITIENDDAPSVVAGRQLFYNQSAFDGDDTAINSADDGAIATDKTAYLPGSGLATFANVSSYSRGINGIMVDLLGGVDHANISASDFVFKTGNNNAPGSWAELTVTPTVSVRIGAGPSGADRVEITWAANTITNTWLEVQVLPTLQTGLTAADVFYWGSKVGDVGVATPGSVFLTSATDVTSVRYHLAGEAPITAAGDFNRDGSVTAADATLAVSNFGTIVRLQLGEPPVATVAAVDTSAVAVGLVASAGPNSPSLFSTVTTSDPQVPTVKAEARTAATAAALSPEMSVVDSIGLDGHLDDGDLDDDLVTDLAVAWSTT